jgi:hypothetical protein
MAGRINTIMQTCYFAISGVLPKDEAIAAIKYAIKKTYGKRGDAVVQKNYEAVDSTLANLVKDHLPDAPTSNTACPDRPGRRAGFRPARHRPDARRQGRPAARQRLPRRWHLAHRHHPVGKTQHRRGNPGLGNRPLHPVQQMRHRLPARRHPAESIQPALSTVPRHASSPPSSRCANTRA